MFKIILDKSKISYNEVKAKQYDTLIPLEVEFYNQGVPVQLREFDRFQFKVLKNDGTFVIQETGVSIQEPNTMFISLDKQVSYCSGNTPCEISLYKGEKMDTSFTFYINYDQSVVDEAINSKNTITLIEELDKSSIKGQQIINEINEAGEKYKDIVLIDQRLKVVEGRLTLAESEISKTNYKVDQLAEVLSDTRQEILKLHDFDLAKTSPTYHTILNPARGTVLQCFIVDENSDNIYLSQVKPETLQTNQAETYIISKLDKYGNLLDSMELLYGGHGTIFGLEVENNTVYIWANWDVTDLNGIKTGSYELVRFPYTANTTLTLNNPSVIKYNKFTTSYVTPIVDQKSDKIAFRVGTGVELRRLSEVKLGVNKVYGTVVIPTNINYLQGASIDNNILYWRSGDSNGANYKDYITVFNLTSGQQIYQVECNVGYDKFGNYEDNFREPESIQLYTDKKSGKKSLFVGVVTGGTDRRILKSYAYHEIGAGEKFTGELMSGVQHFPLTSNDGHAKLTPTAKLISDIRRAGTYYMKTQESASYTDHPQPDGGYWLIVEPSDFTGNNFIQVLRKNTGKDTNLIEFQRCIQIQSDGSLGGTEWIPTLTGNTRTIPSSINQLSNLVQDGYYYITTIESNNFLDHPEKGVAGWFMFVSKSKSGSLYQELRKNSAVHENMRVYCRNITPEGTISPWRNMLGERKVLWSGDCKGKLGETQVLNESINSYDYIYISLDNDTGRNAVDRWIDVKDWVSNECQFVFNNIPNTAGVLELFFFEYAIVFGGNRDTFAPVRSTRMKLTSSGMTRTDQDSTIGIRQIVGVKI